MDEKKIEILPATEKDIPAIYDITQEAFHKYAFDLAKPELVMALKETYEDIRGDIQNKHVLVAFLDSVPVGSIRYEFLHGVGYLSRFGVKLCAQSSGVGSVLLNSAIKECKDRGWPAVVLHTSAKMSSLVRFYYGKGFYIRSTSTDRGYVRALLVKELVPGYEVDAEALKP